MLNLNLLAPRDCTSLHDVVIEWTCFVSYFALGISCAACILSLRVFFAQDFRKHLNNRFRMLCTEAAHALCGWLFFVCSMKFLCNIRFSGFSEFFSPELEKYKISNKKYKISLIHFLSRKYFGFLIGNICERKASSKICFRQVKVEENLLRNLLLWNERYEASS